MVVGLACPIPSYCIEPEPFRIGPSLAGSQGATATLRTLRWGGEGMSRPSSCVYELGDMPR
jgi:hypothetical protein